MPRVLQDVTQREHRELRAGAPADLSRRPFAVASLRAMARPVEGIARRCAGALPRAAVYAPVTGAVAWRPAGYIIQPDGREEIAAALASCSGFALYVES